MGTYGIVSLWEWQPPSKPMFSLKLLDRLLSYELTTALSKMEEGMGWWFGAVVQDESGTS